MLGSTRIPYTPLKRPTQRRAQLTYQALLDATARILTTRGYAELTTNHVAEVAGVSIGSLYEYVRDKETLVAELARRTLAEILRDVSRGLETATADRSTPRGLRDGIAVMFDAIDSRRALVRALWQVPFLAELPELRALPQTFLAMMRAHHGLLAAPAVRPHPEAASYLLSIMVSNAIVHAAAARPKNLSRADVEDALVRMLIALLAPEPSRRHGIKAGHVPR